MKFLQTHSRSILWITFAISAILMIADLALKFNSKICFYAMTNAVLLFRLFGGSQLPFLIHAVVFILLFIFICLYRDNYQFYVLIILLVPLIIHMALSIYTIWPLQSRMKMERARRVGMHAYLGFMIIVLWFWVFVFIMKGTDVPCILGMFYMLFFLFMVLTPYFQSDTQAVKIVEKATKRRRKRSSASKPSHPPSSSAHPPTKTDAAPEKVPPTDIGSTMARTNAAEPTAGTEHPTAII